MKSCYNLYYEENLQEIRTGVLCPLFLRTKRIRAVQLEKNYLNDFQISKIILKSSTLPFCLKSTRYFALCFADNCLLLFRSESRKLLVLHVPDNCSHCFYLSDQSCSLEREICCTAGIEIPLHHAFNKISAERRAIPFMQQIVCKTLKLQS